MYAYAIPARFLGYGTIGYPPYEYSTNSNVYPFAPSSIPIFALDFVVWEVSLQVERNEGKVGLKYGGVQLDSRLFHAVEKTIEVFGLHPRQCTARLGWSDPDPSLGPSFNIGLYAPNNIQNTTHH